MEVWFMDVSWWKKTTPNYQLIQREVAPVEGTWTPSTQKSMRNVRKTPDGFRKIGDTKKMVTLRCWQVPHNKQDYKLHVGGWTNPFEGYLILVYISQTRSFPQSEHEKYSKPPPRLLWSLAVVSALDPLRSLPHKKTPTFHIHPPLSPLGWSWRCQVIYIDPLSTTVTTVFDGNFPPKQMQRLHPGKINMD